jgi:CRP/FNR family transcriptional regulator
MDAISTTDTAKAAAIPLLVRAVGESQFRALFAERPVESIDQDLALFWEGDAADHVFELREGALRLFKMTPDGRRAITGFILPGEFLGVSYKDRYICTAEAATAARFQRYPRAKLHTILSQSPGLGHELLAMACDELSAAQDQMLLLGRKSAHERIASFLLSVARRLSPDAIAVAEIDLPMSRLDIADYLGLTIETVSRVLSRFKTEGLIALPTSHRVMLRQLAGLEALAGGASLDSAAARGGRRIVQPAAWPN